MGVRRRPWCGCRAGASISKVSSNPGPGPCALAVVTRFRLTDSRGCGRPVPSTLRRPRGVRSLEPSTLRSPTQTGLRPAAGARPGLSCDVGSRQAVGPRFFSGQSPRNAPGGREVSLVTARPRGPCDRPHEGGGAGSLVACAQPTQQPRVGISAGEPGTRDRESSSPRGRAVKGPQWPLGCPGSADSRRHRSVPTRAGPHSAVPGPDAERGRLPPGAGSPAPSSGVGASRQPQSSPGGGFTHPIILSGFFPTPICAGAGTGSDGCCWEQGRGRAMR